MNAATVSPDLRRASAEAELAECVRSFGMLTNNLKSEVTAGANAVMRSKSGAMPMLWLNSVQGTVTILADLSRSIERLRAELDREGCK